MSLKKMVLVFVVCLVFFNVSSFYGTEYTSNIQSLILEDFELGTDGNPARVWALIPDRFGRKGSLDSGESLQKISWVKAWPEAYFGKEVADKGKGEFFYGPSETENDRKRYTDVSGTCLGLYLAFNRQGYNMVELYPLAKTDDGKFEKSPLRFKGKVKQIDMWMWGANFNYYVEMVLLDYRGVEHRLDVGSIRHIGWKNFVVQIPNYIPQSIDYIPSSKVLSLLKLVVWTTPNEKVSGAYMYVDQIKYLADVYTELYDGYQLGDPSKIKSVWEKGSNGPKESDIKP